MKKMIMIIVYAVVFGLFVGIYIKPQWNPIPTHKEKIENQLTRYKEAQEVCGERNVEEITKYVNARTEDTGNYTCKIFAEAARSPEVERREKEMRDKDDALYTRYIEEYAEKGGILTFFDWKERNIK